MSKNSDRSKSAQTAGDEVEVQILRERHEGLIARITELRQRNAELASADEQLWVADAHIQKLREIESDLRNEVERMRGEAAEQHNQNNKDRARISELELDFFEQSAEKKQLTTEIAHLKSKVAQIEKQAFEAGAKLNETQSILDDQLRELDIVRRELDSERVEHSRTLATWKAELEQERTRNAKERSEERAEQNRKIAAIADQNWAKDIELEQLAQQGIELQTKMADLQKQLQDRTDTAEKLSLRISEESAQAASNAKQLAFEHIAQLAKLESDYQASRTAAEESAKRALLEAHEKAAKAQDKAAELSAALATNRSEMENLKRKTEQQIRHFNDERQRDAEKSIALLLSTRDQHRIELDKVAAENVKRASEVEARFKTIVAARELDLQTLKLDLERSLADTKSWQAQCAERDSLLRASRQELAENVKRAAEVEAGFQTIVAARELDLQALKLDLERSVADTKSWQSQCSQKEDLIRASRQELADLKSQHESEKTAFALENKQERVKFEDRLAKSEEALQASENRIAMLAKERLAEVEVFRFSEAKLVAQISALKTDAQRRATMLRECKETIQSLQSDLTAAQTAVQKLRTERTAVDNDVVQLRTFVLSEQAGRRTLEQQIKASDIEIARLKSTLDELTDDKQILTSQSAKLATEIKRLKEELSEVIAQDLSKTSVGHVETERLEKWSQQLNMRETQLRHYASSISKEKSEIMQFAQRLTQEVQMVSSTHPLKDYLAATEFELSKTEVQLKTTPTLSSERVRLGEYVAKLIEQRDFLRALLASSKKQYDEQIKLLQKMIESGRLSPVPPPPPGPMANTNVQLNRNHAPGSSSVAPSSASTQLVEHVRWEKPLQDL